VEGHRPRAGGAGHSTVVREKRMGGLRGRACGTGGE
jgi:hypothetical protein